MSATIATPSTPLPSPKPLPPPLTLTTIHQTPPSALPDLYTTLHRRATASGTTLLSITPLSTLQSRISDLASSDPHRNLPLHGVPYIVKDNIDAPPHSTTNACPAFSHIPAHAAPVVRALHDAGAVLLAKSNMDQFATGLVGTRSPYGAVENARDAAFVAGGSSAGSAVAVVTGLAAFSLGTDTAGSGRVPAAMGGIVGLKPTKGVISTRGVAPACASLDCVSVFANNVSDAAFVLACVQPAFEDYDDPWARVAVPQQKRVSVSDVQHTFRDVGECAGLRVAIPDKAFLSFDGDERARASFESAVTVLRSLRADVVDVNFEPFSRVGAMLYEGAFVAERYAAVGEFIEGRITERPEDFDPTVAAIITGGAKWRASDVFRLQEAVRRWSKIADRTVWNEGIDVLMVPSVPRPVTRAEVERDPVKKNSLLGTYTNFVNLMDYCAVAVPAPTDGSGVPLGVTFIAKALEDRLALGVALRFEEAVNDSTMKVK